VSQFTPAGDVDPPSPRNSSRLAEIVDETPSTYRHRRRQQYRNYDSPGSSPPRPVHGTTRESAPGPPPSLSGTTDPFVGSTSGSSGANDPSFGDGVMFMDRLLADEKYRTHGMDDDDDEDTGLDGHDDDHGFDDPDQFPISAARRDGAGSDENSRRSSSADQHVNDSNNPTAPNSRPASRAVNNNGVRSRSSSDTNTPAMSPVPSSTVPASSSSSSGHIVLGTGIASVPVTPVPKLPAVAISAFAKANAAIMASSASTTSASTSSTTSASTAPLLSLSSTTSATSTSIGSGTSSAGPTSPLAIGTIVPPPPSAIGADGIPLSITTATSPINASDTPSTDGSTSAASLSGGKRSAPPTSTGGTALPFPQKSVLSPNNKPRFQTMRPGLLSPRSHVAFAPDLVIPTPATATTTAVSTAATTTDGTKQQPPTADSKKGLPLPSPKKGLPSPKSKVGGAPAPVVYATLRPGMPGVRSAITPNRASGGPMPFVQDLIDLARERKKNKDAETASLNAPLTPAPGSIGNSTAFGTMNASSMMITTPMKSPAASPRAATLSATINGASAAPFPLFSPFSSSQFASSFPSSSSSTTAPSASVLPHQSPTMLTSISLPTTAPLPSPVPVVPPAVPLTIATTGTVAALIGNGSLSAGSTPIPLGPAAATAAGSSLISPDQASHIPTRFRELSTGSGTGGPARSFHTRSRSRSMDLPPLDRPTAVSNPPAPSPPDTPRLVRTPSPSDNISTAPASTSTLPPSLASLGEASFSFSNDHDDHDHPSVPTVTSTTTAAITTTTTPAAPVTGPPPPSAVATASVPSIASSSSSSIASTPSSSSDMQSTGFSSSGNGIEKGLPLSAGPSPAGTLRRLRRIEDDLPAVVHLTNSVGSLETQRANLQASVDVLTTEARAITERLAFLDGKLSIFLAFRSKMQAFLQRTTAAAAAAGASSSSSSSGGNESINSSRSATPSSSSSGGGAMLHRAMSSSGMVGKISRSPSVDNTGKYFAK
jgi:hypothetical protein